MNFVEALKRADLSTQSLRRGHWGKDAYWYLDGRHLFIRQSGPGVPLLHIRDMLADDWEIRTEATRLSEPMSFADVLIHLKNGAKASRLGWSDPFPGVVFRDGELRLFKTNQFDPGGDLCAFGVTYEDMEAVDWVLCDSPMSPSVFQEVGSKVPDHAS